MKAKLVRAATIDAYIAGFPPPVRAKLQTVRRAIRGAAPKAKEKISYGMPALFMKRVLVYFAGYRNHIGLYPGAGAITKFARLLGAYETSKGTVRFPLDQPIPVALIERIVRFRVKMEEERT